MTAIALADTDGNAATDVVPGGWTPHVATPPYSDYTSGHACVTGATTGALEHLFGSSLMPSVGRAVPARALPSRRTPTPAALDDETMNARIWLGYHFRFAMTDGNALGHAVADLRRGEHLRTGRLNCDPGARPPDGPPRCTSWKRFHSLVGCVGERAAVATSFPSRGATIMVTTYKATPDIDVLTSNIAIPGLGLVPVNAFVLHGSEPVLVDTGAVIERDDFMAALRSVIDPADLKWIWLTHTDFDHIGTLHQLLAENPQLRVITTFLGVGIMGLSDPLPMDRVYLVNPGQTITVGDRTLTAIKPPIFDNPSTTGFHDEKSGAFFSSDCFGALLQAVPAERRRPLRRRSAARGRCSGRRWTHRGCTRSTAARSRRSSTASAGWSRR